MSGRAVEGNRECGLNELRTSGRSPARGTGWRGRGQLTGRQVRLVTFVGLRLTARPSALRGSSGQTRDLPRISGGRAGSTRMSVLRAVPGERLHRRRTPPRVVGVIVKR